MAGWVPHLIRPPARPPALPVRTLPETPLQMFPAMDLDVINMVFESSGG